jgi:hypothetical protein
MASGFQQDLDQLQPRFYRVVINLSGYPTTGNAGGGVTPNSSDSFAVLPTTTASGQLRAQGNMRFRNIVNRISGLADCQFLDISITEANGDTQATSLAFTIKFDRDASVLDTVKKQIYATTGAYIGFDGSTVINSTLLAIHDQIARGISDATSANVRVYDGTAKQDTQQLITVVTPDTAANVWVDVTSVTLIDTATLTGS